MFARLRRVSLILQIVTILMCLSMPVLAQTPSPSPTPPPANPAGSLTFPNLFRKLVERASTLIPILQNEIETPLRPWLEDTSWGVAVLVIFFAFARVWRENSGAGVDLFWWFARLTVILILMGNGPALVNNLQAIGQGLVKGGSDLSSESALYKFYRTQRSGFEDEYSKFTSGLFTVIPTGENLKPLPDGRQAVLGVIHDVVASPQGADDKLESISHNLPLLFSGLSFARGIIAFGDLYLLLLGGFLMIAVRLAAPIMVALAIDRNLAQRVSYPFLWGTIVLTLIWPFVVCLIKALAYMGGNLAMALNDDAPSYHWDPQRMQAINTIIGAEPVYAAILAIVIMTIAGLSLWASPFIAYKIASGQVYESISSTVSGWMGAIVGAGVEFYSASVAASITRQAEQTQLQGQYVAEVTRAAAGLEANNLQTRAGRILQWTGARGQLETTLGGIYGGLARATGAIGTEMRYGNESAANLRNLNTSDIGARNRQAVADLNVDRTQQGRYIEADRSADTEHWLGGKFLLGSDWAGRELYNRGYRWTGLGTQLIGGGIGLGLQYDSIQSRAEGKVSALNEGVDSRIANQELASRALIDNQGVYYQRTIAANERRAQGLTSAEVAGAQMSAIGANRGFEIATRGIGQAYNLNMRANRAHFVGAVTAAEHVLGESVKAAQLRAVASVLSSVGHNIARNAEHGMALRY